MNTLKIVVPFVSYVLLNQTSPMLSNYGVAHAADVESVACTPTAVVIREDAFTDSGLPVLSGSIAGHSVKFLLDFSSGQSFIDRRIVEGFGLPTVPRYTVKGSDGKTLAIRAYTPDRMTLETLPLNLDHFDFLIPPQEIEKNSGNEPYITLGSDLFESLGVEIDPLHQRVRIFDEAKCEKPSIFWRSSSPFVVKLNKSDGQDGFTLDSVLDALPAPLRISYRFPRSVVSGAEGRDCPPISSIEERGTSRLGTFPTLALGSAVTLKNIRADLQSGRKSQAENPNQCTVSVTLGLRELIQFHAYFSSRFGLLIASTVSDKAATESQAISAAGQTSKDFTSDIERIKRWREGYLKAP